MTEKKIGINEVKKVAKLSQLNISDSDAEKFTEQLNDILEYASKINGLDTDDIEPTAHSISMKNVLREDIVKPSIDRKKLSENAPDFENGFFKVPKIIE